MHRLREYLSRPYVLRRAHGWATLGWAALIPISLLTSLKTSLLWIVLISCYANFASHFSAWQASRVEVQMADGDPAVRAVDADEEDS